MKITTHALPGLLLLLTVSHASAQPEASAMAEDARAEHIASITISPVHLAIGLVEVTGEFQVARRLGIAGTVGGGRMQDISVYEVGAQLCYYLTGDFDGGLHLGA